MRDVFTKVKAKFKTLIRRGVVVIATDSTDMQTLQVEGLADETEDEIEHFQPFGLDFQPPPNAEVLLASIGGDVDNTVALQVSARESGAERPTTPKAPGEGGLHYLGDYKVYLAADGTIHLGKRNPLDAIALASKVDTYIAMMDAVMRTWVVVPTDGGGALKTAFTAAFPSAPLTVKSLKVKAE